VNKSSRADSVASVQKITAHKN